MPICRGNGAAEIDSALASAPADPEARIRANVFALLRFQLEHPYFHRLMIDEIFVSEFFVMGAPILKVAFGKDYDAEAIAREYEKFIRDYVVDGLHRR